jgi:hypothetical protein
MWRSTFLGISTNVAVNFMVDSEDNYEGMGAVNDFVMQYGATLTYQGSVMNQTVRVERSLCCCFYWQLLVTFCTHQQMFLSSHSSLRFKHACLHTMNKDLRICVNFANPRCGSGGESAVKDISTHFDPRRRLFGDLVKVNPYTGPGSVNDAEESSGANNVHRMMEEKDCTLGVWCQDFASLELVGPW